MIPINKYSQLSINNMDKKVLRDLACEVAELASRPIENEKRNIWYKHNSLEYTQPVIFCDPENGWNEIITDNQLQCKGELARDWEKTLRKEIFRGKNMQDDKVIEATFYVDYIADETDWGMDVKIIGGEDGGSYTWDPPLKRYEDMEKLKYPEIIVDYDKTYQILQLAKEVFDGILKIRLKGIWLWSVGLTQILIKLRGLSQMLYDMYDYPEELHNLMNFLKEGMLKKIKYLEENNLLSLNNDGTYVGSGGFGWTHELPQKDFKEKVRTIDIWGFAESQETANISPEMFKEFIFPYYLPLVELFGLNCYGCCEPLNNKWDIISKIPRLRRVSVSPWADIEDMAIKLGPKYIFSWKPNPAYLAVQKIDEDFIRNYIRKAFEIAKKYDCRMEVIMKDIHTIGKNPQNVINWCRIAKEEASSF